MSQHDYDIANSPAATVRADINNALKALLSWNSGATAPTVTFAYMRWLDTSSSPATPKIRNAANTAWVVLPFRIDIQALKSNIIEEGTAGSGVTIDGLTIKDSGFALGSDADGDAYIRNSGALARVPKGSNGQIWKMVSGLPAWSATDIHSAIGSIGGGTCDLDLAVAGVFSATVDTGATTFTFSNAPSSPGVGVIVLYLTNGGSQTINWPGAVDWGGGGIEPLLTTAGLDILVFTTIDAGTTWHGSVSSTNSKSPA